MSSPTKNYKIIVDSKHFGNMRGISPAEVAKKAAGKILGLSNNKITRFSMVETKNGKIRNYKAFKENLIRPYHKNGKLIKCRIIVKKIGKQSGGGEAESLSAIYTNNSNRKLTDQEKEIIFNEMKVIDTQTDKFELYTPLELINITDVLANNGRLPNLTLGVNDPIRHFLQERKQIVPNESNYGWWTIIVDSYKFNYEFKGIEDSFSLYIWTDFRTVRNRTVRDKTVKTFKQCISRYVKFLKKLYPGLHEEIMFDNKPIVNSNGNSNN